MPAYIQAKDDRLKPLRKQLLCEGLPVDLSGSTITFRMVNRSTLAVKVAAGTVVVEDAQTGRVRYEWQPADVDTVGDFYAWFIQTGGGKNEHYPSDPSFVIKVVQKL